MRKAIKIKAFIFLLAWAMIFAHSIIPHNHFENLQGCDELVHNSFLCSPDDDKSLKLENERSELQVCHLSNSLFNIFNPEIFLAFPGRDINFVPVSLATGIIPVSGQSYISDHLKSAGFLRAPPTL